MKNSIPTFLLIFIFLSCKSKNSEYTVIDSVFEKPYKELNNNSFQEHIDSTSNIYSNFKYSVAFDGPDKWKFDKGVSEHTIYRTFELDSAITFSLNVIEEKKFPLREKKTTNIWDLYLENKEQMDKYVKITLAKQLNTKIEGFKVTKTYLKNEVALRRTFKTRIKNMGYEYSNTSIQYQVLKNSITFTFSLSVPTIFYEEEPNKFEWLFNNIYFLKNKESLNMRKVNYDEKKTKENTVKTEVMDVENIGLLLERVAEEINKKCPMRIDKDTRLENVVALSNNTFQYNYTLVNVEVKNINVEATKRKFTPLLLEKVKTNPELKRFRNNNVTVSYSYSDKNGSFILIYKATPELYKKNK